MGGRDLIIAFDFFKRKSCKPVFNRESRKSADLNLLDLKYIFSLQIERIAVTKYTPLNNF